MQADGQDWFGPPFISLVCDMPAAGKYAVSIEALQGPEQAIVQLFQHEVPAGDAVDLYAAETHRGPAMRLGTLSCEEGPLNLMLKLVGRHPQSRGLGLDLISIQCERVD